MKCMRGLRRLEIRKFKTTDRRQSVQKHNGFRIPNKYQITTKIN